MCVWVVARLHQRLKSTFFEIFSSLHCTGPFGARSLCLNFFQKTLILAFEPNSTLSQNYTFFRVLAHCATILFSKHMIIQKPNIDNEIISFTIYLVFDIGCFKFLKTPPPLKKYQYTNFYIQDLLTLFYSGTFFPPNFCDKICRIVRFVMLPYRTC